MAKIVNLTPATVRMLNEEGSIIARFPHEGFAYVASAERSESSLNGIEVWSKTFGQIWGLPDPQEQYECDGEGDAYGCCPSSRCCGCNHQKPEKVYYIVSESVVWAAKVAGRRTDDLLVTSYPVYMADDILIGYRMFKHF